MNGRIYTCHHYVPDRIASNALFSTFVSGVRSDGASGLVGDLDGVNIAAPNWHSEMRHQYHVWQERLTGMDYVGFEHYRRIFFINPFNAVQLRRHQEALLDVACRFAADENCIALPLGGGMFSRYLDLRDSFDAEMKSFVDQLMTDNDVITQRPHAHRMDEQFKECHATAHWEVLVGAVRNTRFFARAGNLIEFSLRSPAYCNMYIMRTELFLEYMEFWWEAMRVIEQRVPKNERYYGYLSERLANVFLFGKRMQDPGLRTRALPFVIDPR